MVFTKQVRKPKASEGQNLGTKHSQVPQNKDLDFWICLECSRNAKGPVCLSEQGEGDSEDWRFYYTTHRDW